MNSDKIKIHNTIHNHLKIPSFNNEKLIPDEKAPSTESSFKSIKYKSNSPNSFNPINSSEPLQIKNPFKKNSIFNNDMENNNTHSNILFKNRIKKKIQNDGIKNTFDTYSHNDNTNSICLKPSTIILSKKINLYPTKNITKKIFKYNNQRKTYVKIKMLKSLYKSNIWSLRIKTGSIDYQSQRNNEKSYFYILEILESEIQNAKYILEINHSSLTSLNNLKNK